LGDILSRIDLSDLERKSLEYSLESDSDACGSGLLSVALTEEQEAEAKKLYRVLFRFFRIQMLSRPCHLIRSPKKRLEVI